MAFHLQKRRRAHRAPLNRPVQISGTGGGQTARGIEVSTGGMSLWMQSQPKAGSMVTVNFTLPGSAFQITAMARVVWEKAAGGKGWYKAGLQFVALPREERNIIGSYVNKLARCYRDLHILLSMNKWKFEQLQELARQANLESFRDVQDLKQKVARALDGFRA
jgi:c-di-GMP-binding flagellar brake protein YcgR